jgi:beta-aspartyl-peptidase (threonine type)
MLRLALLLLFAAAARAAGSPGYGYSLAGDPADVAPATEGALFLVGGAMSSGDKAAMEVAMRWFARKAGGGNLLVLGASDTPSAKPSHTAAWFAELGAFSSVELVEFHARNASADPRVLALAARAEGIFLLGGDQADYITLWEDTPFAAALNAHLAAGKPIGGTSAGLAVLGEHHYAALRGSVTTAQALSNPFDPDITLGSSFLAAPALAGVITDTHFGERERLGRLVAFLARLQAAHPSTPRLLGLGVDEGTALCVEPDFTARVHSSTGGSVWLVRLDAVDTLTPGKPLGARATATPVSAGGSIDLRTLATDPPAPARSFRAAAGRLAPAPLERAPPRAGSP